MPLKNFPYLIEHTIQNARDNFEGIFKTSILDTKKYLKDPSFIKTLSDNDKTQVYKNIKFVLDNIPQNFDDCIKTSYNFWHDESRNKICQLIHKFPKNHLTSSGLPFWSGTKKFPKPLEFDLDNELHYTFILSFSSLWAFIFNIDTDKLIIKKTLSMLKPKEFVPKNDFVVRISEKSQKKVIMIILILIESIFKN